MKVLETITTFKEIEQGGPLFFIIMINKLTVKTEEEAASLLQSLLSLKISDIDGQNVDKAVSLIRGAAT
jgi:hypothetical protein